MRTRIDKIMAVGGLSLILLETLLAAETPLSFVVVLFGILLTCAGILGLGRRLQPEGRIYLQLRAEVDDFLTLVRKINAQIVAAEGEQASQTNTSMHESVERIAHVAGVVSGQK